MDGLSSNYFRLRDFEYVQPLYDLAFLLEVDALAKGTEVPKYRIFSLWRAGYSLDSYDTRVDQWLDGTIQDEDIDYVPSSRIKQYLLEVRRAGTIPELRAFRGERFDRCLRLRSVRGLGPSKIALTVSSNSLDEDWFSQAAINLSLDRDRIAELYQRNNDGPWQTGHVVPPLLRFMRTIEILHSAPCQWSISGLGDPFAPVSAPLSISNRSGDATKFVEKALRRNRQFRLGPAQEPGRIRVRHQMGWSFTLEANNGGCSGRTVCELAHLLDPLTSSTTGDLLSDLHLHTAWSDGSAAVTTMASAAAASGLRYFAVTDHSRSCKLQGGLTPPLWLRQANALTLAEPVCPILHGVEVDILKDGTLDLPHSLLAAADLVVASVHSNWSADARLNTDRLLKAIETGCIDVIGHPTSAVVGKPGVPDYVRPSANVHWDDVFQKCAQWRVALEFNCFPSRLDLPLQMLERAVSAGCPISVGSDSHARSHLINLRFGKTILSRLHAAIVLNRFDFDELRTWVNESRKARKMLAKSGPALIQGELFEPTAHGNCSITARIQPPQKVPMGSRAIGLDLTAGDKATGVALLEGYSVETCSLSSDDEILAFIGQSQPSFVSIDSPLGLPGGGEKIDPKAGIVRVAEYDLASVGIPAYPALIDSMRELTLRGIRLRRAIEQLPSGPTVIESYPGAAQDILCIPRKQKSLDLLREGLRRLGLTGLGLATRSHDEMDAITAAIVARYYEAGVFEPMGIPKEAELIVPKIRPLLFERKPVICLAGKTGAGKSVVARYLALFYGFRWVRTRDVIRELLFDDLKAPPSARLSSLTVAADSISERELRDFGAAILNVHKQIPLRNRLTQIVQNVDEPIVIDSIRDLDDVNGTSLDNRERMTWYIDCDDAHIRRRLAGRSKLGVSRLNSASPVDKTAPVIRASADATIWNGTSLEELRWRVDDLLFSLLDLS